jgi:hypothetical protein
VPTAGDLLTRDVACRWLDEAGVSYDVAVAPPLEGGVDLEAVDPARYTHLLFVCGPLGNGEPATGLFSRFSTCRQIGLNLSMLHPLEEWNPFDLLLERDSSATARPDLSLLAEASPVPVVGVILVHEQKEYAGGRHAGVHEEIERLLDRTEVAVVRIDTVLDVPNAAGLRTPAEVESLIARMDAVITTRLHGGVLAIKHGVPALMVDPVEGGAKLRYQAGALRWPALLVAEQVTDAALDDALAWCLTAEARAAAVSSAKHCRAALKEVHERFLAEVR